MKKNKFIIILNILLYILFFVLIVNKSLSYLDVDFGWHLKIGEEVYLNKNIPTINHYNYIFPENDNFWVDHEWLSNLLIYIIYNNFGYLALTIFFALIFLTTIFLLNNFIIKNITKTSASSIYILVTELLLIKGVFPHSGIRVQEISWLFFLLFLIIIYYFEKRSLINKKNNWKILIWIVPILYLWSNLHASFLLGIAILFFYLLIKIIEKFVFQLKNKLIKKISIYFNFSKILKNKDLFIFGTFSLIASLSTLITPYGLKLFDFLFVYGKNTAYLKIIAEWLPPFIYPIMYWQLIYIAIIITVWITVWTSFFIIKKNNPHKNLLTPWNISLNLLFLILVLKSRRHFPLFFIASLPTLINILLIDFKNIARTKETKKNNIDILLKLFIVFTIIITITSISLKISFFKNPFTAFCHNYPCQAISFLKDNHNNYIEYNFFNSYKWGGYLIHEYPEKKLFIDGRLPQKTLKNHSYVEEYALFYSNNKNVIKEKLNEYDIKLILLSKDKPVKLNWFDKKIFNIKEENFKKTNTLIEYLDDSYDWKKIYEDNISLIYEKTF